MVNAHSPTADFNRVEVRGKYVGWEGSIPTGTVTFTPRVARAVDTGVLTVIIARPISATIGGDGTFSVLLPATDDPDISTPFSYAVVENFAGGASYDIKVPIAAEATGIDIATVAQAIPVSGLNGSLLIENGASVPSSTSPGTIIFEKDN